MAQTLIGRRVRAFRMEYARCTGCRPPHRESGPRGFADDAQEFGCGCTSIRLREGRPAGRRHKDWSDLARLFELDGEGRVTAETVRTFGDDPGERGIGYWVIFDGEGADRG